MDPNQAMEIDYPNNNNNNNKNNNNKKKHKRQTVGDGYTESWREVRNDFYLFLFLSSFLSQIYGNRIVGFCRSRRQNWYTRRELRIGTNILAFCQTLKDRKFAYLCYFEPKCYIMA